MKFCKYTLFCISIGMMFGACNEDTGTLGILPEKEQLIHSNEIFNVYTHSMAMDSVMASSTNCYLGDITDPETGSRIRASFAAQFHTFENYAFPAKERMFPLGSSLVNNPKKQNDSILCDSIEVRLYFENFYGDKDNPMKLEVYPLDINHIIDEDSVFYTDTNIEQYIEPGSLPLATKMFCPTDYTLKEAELISAKHSPNVRISLPVEYGTKMLQTYYKHPEYYKDSYSFIRKVCPGLYFQIKSGNGTMLNVSVSTINLYFHYYDAVCADSIYNGIARFAATPEVIQSTKIENGSQQELIDNENCTYLKTPAGICTVVELPVDEIFAAHPTDSVNKAQLTLTRYNKDNSDYTLGTPQKLLLVRKQDMYSFFENHNVSNSQTSYTCTFDETFNTYTFENICRLVSYCKQEKVKGMKEKGLTDAQWNALYPDWNKAVLIPVETSKNTEGVEVSVTHDLGLNSIQLQGGPRNPIQMQVIYSRFE